MRDLGEVAIPGANDGCVADPFGSATGLRQRAGDGEEPGRLHLVSPRPAAFIWGGMQENHRLTMADDGAAYDPVTRAWTAMPASPLSPRNTAFAAWTGTTALFWGGGNGNGSVLMNGASYDPASRTWTMLPAAPLPTGLDDLQATVWTGTQMVVIQPGAGAAFDPASSSWTALPGLPRSPAGSRS